MATRSSAPRYTGGVQHPSLNVARALAALGGGTAAPERQATTIEGHLELRLVNGRDNLVERAVAAYREARSDGRGSARLPPPKPEQAVMIAGRMTLNGNVCCYNRSEEELRAARYRLLPISYTCTCGTQWEIAMRYGARS